MCAQRMYFTTHNTSFINRILVTVITILAVGVFCGGVLKDAEDTGKSLLLNITFTTKIMSAIK